MSILLEDWSMADWNELVKWARVGANNAMIGVATKVKELPPHGRLIDADALTADIKRQCREVFRVDAVSPDDFWIKRNEAYNERLWETWCESFYGYLQTRPTIIPAEEGET